MQLEFAKMHGLGNDFMVIDGVTQDIVLQPETVRAWSDRRTGVGFDQLLLIEPPTDPLADFRYRIFNADGTEVEQCGNGARCAARYVLQRRLSPKPQLLLQTRGGPITTRLMPPDQVEVDMGRPRLDAPCIPFDPEAAAGVSAATDQPGAFDLELPESLVTAAGVPGWPSGRCRFTPVSMGNPHAVLFVDNVTDAPVEVLGPALVAHPLFPEGANIGFCQIIDRGFIRLRVYERGVGETRACGTGACAAVVAAHLHGRVDARVKVSLPGGKVRINWPGQESTVKMTGPATFVFEGRIEL